ncbi:hypothetical protein GQ54DRAFT_310763 [Martensiomyces pterosporus]|nr:hypothetical protein GQ54DRAFT_310763 [Martensiomyces pterosporus]
MSSVHTLTADEKAWAARQVAMIIGATAEDAAPLADFLAGIDSANELQSQLVDMLGESPMALDFAFALIAKRFPPKEPQTTPANTGSAPAVPQRKTKANAQSAAGQADSGGGSVDARRKADPSDIAHFSGADSHKGKGKGKDRRQQEPQPKETETSGQAPPAEQKSQRQLKKERHQAMARQREEAERKRRLANRKRVKCECQASEHALFTNCLTCGRIICDMEGPGPCMFCGSEVESPDQQLQQHMRRLLRRREEAEEQEKTAKERVEKKKADERANRSARSMLYSMKAGGGMGTREAERLWSTDDKEGEASAGEAVPRAKGEELTEEEYLALAFSALGIDPAEADPVAAHEAEAWVKATRRKERLLDYDRTAAQRTKLIDQTADFDPYAVGKWMSPEERIEAEKKRAARTQAEEDREARLRRGMRVLRLNFQNNTVDMARDDEEIVPPPLPAQQQQQQRSQRPSRAPAASEATQKQNPGAPSGTAGAFAHNPLLAGAAEPKFVLSLDELSSESSSKGRGGGKSRKGSADTEKSHGSRPADSRTAQHPGSAMSPARQLERRKQMLRIQNDAVDELY